MSEVGVYTAPGYQGGYLTPILIFVATLFGSHSRGAVSPSELADVAFEAMKGRIREVKTVRTVVYTDAPPPAVEYSER